MHITHATSNGEATRIKKREKNPFLGLLTRGTGPNSCHFDELSRGIVYATGAGTMNNQQVVSMEEMRETLRHIVGSKFPMRLTLSNGDVLVRYLRGFADRQTNMVLISENPYTLAMKVVEIKDIQQLEFGQANSGGRWKTLRAEWLEAPTT